MHQNATSGGQLLFTQQQQQEMMQSLPMLQTISTTTTPMLTMTSSSAESPVAGPDGASLPLNLSTNNSSGSGSPGSDTRSVSSAVINACSLCPSQFPTQDTLALHMMYHAQGGGVGGGITGSNANTYQQHQQQDVSTVFGRPNSASLSGGGSVGVGVGAKASGPSPWMCGKCLYSFDTCDTLAMHMMTKHANDHDANNPAGLQAAANQRHGAAIMASAAEIAQNVVQRVVQSMSGNVMQQQLQLQQQHQLQLQQQQLQLQQQEQQPVFPQPQNMESQQQQQQPAAAALKRPLLEDSVLQQQEFKKRKSSQPMKKQWHCDACEQTYPTRPEYDEHAQFCKASSSTSTPNTPEDEGARVPHCALCDVTFTDMKSLGTHLRSPVHQHKLKREGIAGSGSGTHNPRVYLGSAGEETDGDKSVGYYSGTRSDSSSISVYSDQGGASLSPAFSDATQDTNKMTPLNLITDGDNNSNNQNFSSNRKARNKRASRVSSNALSPESSSSVQQQSQHTNSNNSNSNNKTSSSLSSSPTERATPVQVPGHVSQSGLSPSGEEEEENDQDDEASEVMAYLTSRAKDLVMCKHCKIVYTDKTLYHLHMGLHNLNNQWQCNMCGKQCRNLHEFTSHVIHIKI